MTIRQTTRLELQRTNNTQKRNIYIVIHVPHIVYFESILNFKHHKTIKEKRGRKWNKNSITDFLYQKYVCRSILFYSQKKPRNLIRHCIFNASTSLMIKGFEQFQHWTMLYNVRYRRGRVTMLNNVAKFG